MTTWKTVDCRGHACPKPIIDTNNALKGATEPFVVLVDTELASTNVREFVESQGALVSVAHVHDDFHLTVEPAPVNTAEGEVSLVSAPLKSARNGVVYVSAERLGHGDEALGAKLMASFLGTLSQVADEISHVLFVNAGAKLTVKGSPVLEQLRKLEDSGVHLWVCGTCLDHFDVRDKLAVGKVSNMLAIIETLSKSGRVISP